ncbi:MAG: serine hydrolase [Bacteroidetes bacterium]|nr:serine hydrolase [Bacteroidota bacterium]
MKFKKLLLVLFSFLLLGEISGQAPKIVAGINVDRVKRLEKFVQSEIDKGNIPGAVTMIIHNGTVVHQGALGYKNVSTKTPMKIDDLFYIQSMTKPIISTAFMMLYEEGYFKLDDPVSKYLPEFKNFRVVRSVNDGPDAPTDSLKSEMTITQLMSHSSGLTHGLNDNPVENRFRKGYFKQSKTIQERVSNITKFPLLAQPGTQWNYSAGPDVLCVLIEKFSGMSVNEFLKTRIFDPLEMKSTGYNVPKSEQSKIVSLHMKGNNGTISVAANQPPFENVTVWSGVNGLFSTAADYTTFCQMMMAGGTYKGKQYLSRKTVDLMTSNQTGDLFQLPGTQWGLGFAVVTDGPATKTPASKGLFFWAGANNTHFFIDPKEKLIAIFMTQEGNFTLDYHTSLRQMVYQTLAN